MASFEQEGYCPYQWVDLSSDSRLIGLWSLIGANVVYDMEDAEHCNPDTVSCDKAFGEDPIAYNLLEAIVRRNVNAHKILVHQLHNGACNTQNISDIQKIMCESINPQLIAHADSNFIAIIADAKHGIDLWLWDLISCY